jgi:Protein involved in formate dehydrogenase formation
VDPRTFLDRLRRRAKPSAELLSALGDLDRLGKERPDLEAPARTLSRLLEIAFLSPDASEVVPFDLEALLRGWSEGTPAFRSHPPGLDEPGLIARARSIAKVIGGPDAPSLRDALRKGRIDLGSLAREVFAGRPEAVARRSSEVGVDPEVTASVLRLALLPALSRFSAAMDRVRPEGAWVRGDCPACGSRPLLAESRGLEQRIAYRCGLCASDWPGERLRCPACGESRPNSLRYSFVEGEQERFRLADCESCSYHWKVVATLSPLSPPGLLVADLATYHLEVLAEVRRGSV